MSDDAFSPAGPEMSQRNPSRQTAVADAFAFFAAAGRSRNICRARSKGSRARRFDILGSQLVWMRTQLRNNTRSFHAGNDHELSRHGIAIAIPIRCKRCQVFLVRFVPYGLREAIIGERDGAADERGLACFIRGRVLQARFEPLRLDIAKPDGGEGLASMFVPCRGRKTSDRPPTAPEN